MSLLDGLLIFFTVVLLYFVITYFLHKKDILKKYNISLYGPALLLRTTKGKSFIKKIAGKRRFWKAFGSFGIVFCFILMILMVIILIWQAWTVLGFTPEQRAAIPGPEIALVLPGINPILPLEYIGYILLALVVAIIAHEFSHGILTFAQKLKVKSLGILYLVVPIGAFVEPDEEELKKANTKKRMRVYAAGPLANFVVVIVSLLLFSFVFMSAVQPAAEGVGVLEVHDGSPADIIGIKTGAIVTEINGTNLSDYESFNDRYIRYIQVMNNTKANQTISISWFYEGVHHTREIKLIDRYIFFQSDLYRGKGYNGIYSLIGVKENLDVLKNPFLTDFPRGFLFFYVIPLIGYFQGYNPIVAPFTGQYTITGPLGVLPPALFWIIISALYWIFWLNLAVGLFNVLPMIPLDGGFLFNDAVGSFIKKIKKGISDEMKDRIVRNISIAVSLLILLAIIFPFFVRYI
jgi:membrane-associated protease RseP (regulator of RpoE activity)